MCTGRPGPARPLADVIADINSAGQLAHLRGVRDDLKREKADGAQTLAIEEAARTLAEKYLGSQPSETGFVGIGAPGLHLYFFGAAPECVSWEWRGFPVALHENVGRTVAQTTPVPLHVIAPGCQALGDARASGTDNTHDQLAPLNATSIGGEGQHGEQTDG